MKHFYEKGESKRLVILLHGLANTSHALREVREVLHEKYPDADVFAPRLAIQSLLSTTPVENILSDLMAKIGRLCSARAPEAQYQTITLVGHSMGAVLARKIAILAHGEQADKSGAVPAPFEGKLRNFRAPRAWHHLIDRVILIAGMNRGWCVTSGRSWWACQCLSLAQFLAELTGGKSTILSIRRGAPFLVQTRLQWLALMNPDYGKKPALILVQLLGTIDDKVAPDDSVDYAVDDLSQSGGKASYHYFEVSHSGHDDIVRMAERNEPATAKARQERREKFLHAFGATQEELNKTHIPRAHMDDSLPPAPDSAVKNLVFIIHGIRDKGFWTKKIARSIKAESTNARFESLTESYGYFPMLPFLLRWGRQRKVEWLMDRYCEARARYPDAVFHFVGHSNGTYLATDALERYPAARFSRIVLAGSVVRRDFDWKRLIGTGQAGNIVNYVATADWVVAIFPKGLQPLKRWLNLGSAGHDGFADPAVHQMEYVSGGHGAGVAEAVWEEMAKFIVHGELPDRGRAHFTDRQHPGWRFAGWVSSFILVLIACALLAVGGALIYWIYAAKETTVIATLILCLYVVLVKTIITEV